MMVRTDHHGQKPVGPMAIGVSQPNAAASMAMPDSAMPATILWTAMPRAPGDDDRIRDPIEAVNKDDDVRCLRRGAGASGAHRDANVGRRERGSIG